MNDGDPRTEPRGTPELTKRGNDGKKGCTTLIDLLLGSTEVSTLASQQRGPGLNLGWGLSVWSLNVLPVRAQVCFGHSNNTLHGINVFLNCVIV